MKATRLHYASNVAIFTYELCAHDRERLTEHGNDGQFCALQTAIANTIPRSTLLRKTTFLAWSTLQRSGERKWKRASRDRADPSSLYALVFPSRLFAAKFRDTSSTKTFPNYKFFSPEKETVIKKYAKVTRK